MAGGGVVGVERPTATTREGLVRAEQAKLC